MASIATPLASRIREWTTGLWLGKSLAMTAELDIPQLIGDGQKNITELATATKTDEDSLFRGTLLFLIFFCV